MFDDSRREFLKHATLLSGAAMIGLPHSASHAQLDQGGVRTRRDIGELALDDPIVETYREAIAQMQALPSDDPRNWVSQARTHLNFCPHGNWFFLPWHRAYLGAFENICRDLTGNSEFALPYWDWAKDPQVPAAFYEETWNGQPNPLLNNTRSVGPDDTIPLDTTGCQVIESVLDETDFELFASGQPASQNSTDSSFQRVPSFSGPLEGTPHNGVHVFVNGDMVTFMSPLDPVFWLHHCNVDRIWALWNARGNPNTDAELWTDFVFQANFVTPQSDLFDVAITDLQDTLGMGYRYDNVPLPVESAMLPRFRALQRVLEKFENREEKGAQLNQETSYKVKLSSAATETARGMAPVTETGAVRRILATVRDVHIPDDLNVAVRVFLNCPYLSPETPSNDPHYVGNFAFFPKRESAEHSQHAIRAYTFDITRTLERLRRSKRNITDELTVQLMPVSYAGRELREMQIRTGGVEILTI